MEEVKKVDVAIVSRYHNLLCSLKTGRPTFSLGYAQKNDELMAEFGRSAFCQHIENFDVTVLIRQVRAALVDLGSAREAIERHNASIQQALTRQEALLLSSVLKERPVRNRTTART
jgi:polysaccharide pyruvyl transferase WcaK-like protein